MQGGFLGQLKSSPEVSLIFLPSKLLVSYSEFLMNKSVLDALTSYWQRVDIGFDIDLRGPIQI